MTTQTPHPTPVGPFTLGPPKGETDRLGVAAAERLPAALPLLDHRVKLRTVTTDVALRGPHLAFSDGQGETRLLRLDRDITHIGRGLEADVRFDESRVSRDHAILVRHGRHFRLLDNRSSNGTYVNRRRITATNLLAGDVIEVGPVKLEFVEID